MNSPAEKILSRAALLERFGRPRRQRLVFTNGCFDLLHAGHVQYLDEARRLGDALVVALNTDRSVREPGSTYQPEPNARPREQSRSIPPLQ